jgi:uncharacterized C2H2 Zn-finger protein
MIKRIISIQMFLLVFMSITGFGQTISEEPDTTRRGAVKIFLDCRRCDMDYIRKEITYINYVRDVNEAQVYILETNQNAGSGGDQYTYTFQGQGEFAGMYDTLIYTSSPDQTSTIIREKRTKMLKIGLMKYVARTPLINDIEISHDAALEREEVVDRWNNWVFELSTEPEFEIEEANKRLELRNSINISKITHDIKLEVEMDQFYDRERFLENTDTDSSLSSTYITNRKQIDMLFVKSLGDHWSAGIKFDIGSSTRENYELKTEILPSIEYDIYPYAESTHRQLRILYSAGYQYNKFVDTTIYNKISEGLYLQMLNVAFEVRKKWGYINMALLGSNYFHDFSKNRIELRSSVNIRVFRGLSLRINGGVAKINDQLNLKIGGISEAERLLQLSELATKYRIGGGIEITYTFGSIFNNVVNPRFSSRRFRY